MPWTPEDDDAYDTHSGNMAQRVSIKLSDPRVTKRKATPAEEREAAGMAAAAKNPTKIKAAPPRGVFDIVKDAFDFSQSYEGDSLGSQIGRAAGNPVYDAIQRETLRRGGATPSQAAAQVAADRAKSTQRVRDTQQQHAEQVADDESRQPQDWESWFKRKAAHVAGSVAGDINPLYATPIGAEGAVGRTVAMGAQAGATDAAGQGLDMSSGVRDDFDPMEVATSAIAGAALQGAGEGVAKGISHVAGKVKTGRLMAAGASHPDYSRLTDVVIGLEGGGSLEHPKTNAKSGAHGVMQVTPDTARDPGYGIRPWNGKTEADLARVGRQKLAVLLGKYGEPDLAMAAYNWGEGNLNKALERHGENWWYHIPRETQEYVANGMDRLNKRGSTGGPVRPMDPHDMAAAMGDPEAAGLDNVESIRGDRTGRNFEQNRSISDIQDALDAHDRGEITADELNDILNGQEAKGLNAFGEDLVAAPKESEASSDNVTDLGAVRQNLDNQKTRNLLDDKLENAHSYEEAIHNDEIQPHMTEDWAKENRETAQKMNELLPDDHPYKGKTQELVQQWTHVENLLKEVNDHKSSMKTLSDQVGEAASKVLQDLHNSPDHVGLRDIEAQWDKHLDDLKNDRISAQEYDDAIAPLKAAHQAILKRMENRSKEYIKNRDSAAQARDASTEFKPQDNVGYEKHTPYVGEPKTPINDQGTKFDRGSGPKLKTLHEYTDREWAMLSNEQKQELLSNAEAKRLKEAKAPLPSPEAVQLAKARGVKSLDELTPEQWADVELDTHGGRDRNPPASSSSLGQRQRGPNYKGPEKPKAGNHKAKNITLTDAEEFKALRPSLVHATLEQTLGGTLNMGRDVYWFQHPNGGHKLGPFVKKIAGRTEEPHERPEIRSQKKKVIDKLGDILDQSTPLRREAEAKMSFERSQRLAMAYAAKKSKPGEAGTRAALAAMKGEMSRPRIKPIADQFSQAEIDGLHDHIWNSEAIHGFEHARAARALDMLLHAGEVPTPSDIQLLAKVMPQKASVWRRLLENEEGTLDIPDGAIKSNIVDTLGVTRTLKASLDVSAPGRQGIFVIGTKHWWKNHADMFKSAWSEEKFHELNEEIRNRPTFELMNKSGLEITKPADKAGIMDREEAFVSKFAEKIPGVRRSERAYLAFLNKTRADVFDDFVAKGERLGIDFVQEPEYLRSAAKFINAATGRGTVKWVGRNGELLSKALFSPKLMASRLQLMNPMFYWKLHPKVRVEAMKQGLIATSAMLSIMGLTVAAGASVEYDPRSSGFGKIKVSNTTFDVTGGFQPYVRFFAQMLLGQQKTSKGVVRNIGATLPILRKAFPGEKQGAFKPTTRLDVMYRFIENKASPNAGEIIRLLRGSDAVGNKLTIGSEAENMFAPLIISDTYHAMQDLGPAGLATAIPNAFGVGVQTQMPKKKKHHGDLIR